MREGNEHGENTSSQSGNDRPSFAEAPAVSLPKGGGAIRGIGEKLSTNPVTGAGSMSVPVNTSPGRSGLGPQLSLSYDSGSGNGPFGFGWSLNLPQISRKTSKGLPQYLDEQESDVFVLSGAEDLVPIFRTDTDGSWLALHPGHERDPDGNWVRGPDGRLVVHEDARDGYRIRRFRPRVEGLYARIERWTRVDNPADVHWRALSKDNVLTIYGLDSNSRIADPTDPRRIFAWLVCETRDDKGNAISYRYKAEDGVGVNLGDTSERNRGASDDLRRSANRYLKTILYGNRSSLLDASGQRPAFLSAEQRDNAAWMFEVTFDYGEHDPAAPVPDEVGDWAYRPDAFSSYRSGFEVRTTRLCQRVLMFHHFPDEPNIGQDCLVGSTDFTYSDEISPAASRHPIYRFLRAVAHTAYRRDGVGYERSSLPPTEFGYTEPRVQDRVEVVDPTSLENVPSGLAGRDYQWTDLHGEGIPGVLTEQSGTWLYKRNLSPITHTLADGTARVAARFGATETVALKPSIGLGDGAQFMDLAGDGSPDLVLMDGPTPGLYEHDDAEGWTRFKPFRSLPNRSLRDPNTRFLDLDGDGHADLLITEHDALVWHPSITEDGFGPARRVAHALDEEQGPRVVLDDGTESIHLVDLSGDGLTDIARIRNGEVCYWPNLGYGRFGAKITMANSPWLDAPDQFDPGRIRLADIDGSGTTDILYLHRDGVCLYFNQSGNGWGQPETLRVFPRIDDLANVQVLDLLGNGTACLVWSSPLPGNVAAPMRYVNLMGDQKPHLLVHSSNNLGAETQIRYAPSTHFYLQDKRDGHPWMTRLPFPVHVVERTEVYDHISRNRFVTRYVYHHGHFDGVEREFNGFGMVEQFDTEEFASLGQGSDFPTGDNIDQQSHIPPVHTKTWFHTGVYLSRQRVSNFFAGLLDTRHAGEYYREDPEDATQAARLLLPDTLLPPGLTLEEEREACRALKGSMLRQEIYALDGSESEAHPYAVTEQNFSVRLIQPKADNRHGVFLTHAREALSYHYERNAADPRVSHALTLAVDDYGNVLRTAAVGYGRREPDPSLPTDEDRARQTQTLMTCSELAYTNAINDDRSYRTPLPSEALNFELSGLQLANGQIRFSFEQLSVAVEAAERIDYHRTATAGSLQKRVLDWSRTLYRRNDLDGPLPLGELDSLALPYQAYQLAFVPEHLQRLFGDRVTETMLTNEGHYEHFDGDDNWWIPSGRAFLSPDAADNPAQELAFARQHFFTARRFQDPFGQRSTAELDAYDLLPEQTQDPLDNTVVVSNNYRLLSPHQITDPNGNRPAVAFDVLGMVTSTAMMGKETENLGDSLDDLHGELQGQLTQDDIDAFFADPRGPMAAQLLGNASSRVIYDVDRFRRFGEPGVAATLARETHVGDLQQGEETDIQVSLAYSDGFGRIIQQKVQAEPGPVTPGELPVLRRWTTSGWTIFNNKGKPVRQYEPFFSPTHAFEFRVEVGVSPVLFYDPVGRVVATVHPNHTWEKIDFDPWQQTSWDVNDTLLFDPASDEHVSGYLSRLRQDDYLPTWHGLRTDPAHAEAAQNRWPDEQQRNAQVDAANKAAAHADTPSIVHFDSLGRPFLSIAHNGGNDRPETRTEQDIEGAPLRIIDARGNAVMVYQIEPDDPNAAPTIGYDAAGRQLFEHSMDAGDRFMLPDIAGQPIRQWDARGHRLRFEYDELRRPLHAFVAGGEVGDTEQLFQRTVYGESQGATLNHRGQVFQLFDQAGVVTNLEYDFKGNLLRGSRQFTSDYKNRVDWSQNPAQDDETFFSHTSYDALNRPTALTTPDESVTLPGYNDANLLERMAVRLQGAGTPTQFVENIDYNAKGQRERIDYATADGTNLTTTYDYDPETFRLTNLRTQRHRDGRVLQNLHYAYDPAGNITSIRDQAQQAVFFANTAVEPHNDYTYDPLYRLIRATGREHAAQHNQQRDAADTDWLIGVPFPNSPEALQRYVEDYAYDSAGNILSMAHSGGDALRWKRCYQYALDSNRLLATGGANEINPTAACPTPYVADATLSQRYEYDVHGNMTRMPHLPSMQWDFQDQLQATSRTVINNGGRPQTTFYVYDAGGQRVRKVTERQAGPGQTPTRQHERIYLGGFEIYREYENDGQTRSLERQTLHVMDDQQRIAQIDTRTVGDDGSPEQSRRFQLGNHLGSVSIELDENAELISFEEYHPYGTTALRVVRSASEGSLKRYRYTGKERDDENGLYYHGARYYACWLGRWTAADPIGIGDGVNLYGYVSGRPISMSDPTGAWGVGDLVKSVGQGVTTTVQALGNQKLPPPRVYEVGGANNPDATLDMSESVNEKKGVTYVGYGNPTYPDWQFDNLKDYWDKMYKANLTKHGLTEESIEAFQAFSDEKVVAAILKVAERYQRIAAIEATIYTLNVSVSPRYEPIAGDNRCNCYATDFVDMSEEKLGAYLPKNYWSRPSRIANNKSVTKEKSGTLSPGGINQWFEKWGSDHGWVKLEGTHDEILTKAQEKANEGYLAVYSWQKVSGDPDSHGHIGLIVFEDDKVKAVRNSKGQVEQVVVTQAGGGRFFRGTRTLPSDDAKHKNVTVHYYDPNKDKSHQNKPVYKEFGYQN
ncbi:RHS repeat-associated core domain protein [Thiorhodococcus drewsii AZ1]|uniref:RHS repeat-associated core domain protein n=1 Tax=Thiorhodococcus drewsii AZ1 TaxID=765913 RepID=G2E4H1_9GAMM|nr:SpvB/TcaC N-terminal domain-containing protein [Thiorhodococcus drewsii]EGV29592.1 RHS repeat-associated core domain protein [Thiorhodococcus drewsii AZ1]